MQPTGSSSENGLLNNAGTSSMRPELRHARHIVLPRIQVVALNQHANLGRRIMLNQLALQLSSVISHITRRLPR